VPVSRRSEKEPVVAQRGEETALPDYDWGEAAMTNGTNTQESALAPVDLVSPGPAKTQLESGTALCLSGGGYRAMVFHVGVLWRLYEAELLKDLKRISSVSGGSITAGVLALNWSKLSSNPADVKRDFVPEVVAPIRTMASKTIDASSVISGALLPGMISDKIANAYRKHLFGRATLQDMPDDYPRFVINSTNVQSGALWRFMKPYMRDWRVGEVKNPTVELAVAVAASSAFPPVLSPVHIELNPRDFTPGSGADLQKAPFTSVVVLTDGGVYDNLGLETAYKRYETILVSDAGGKMQAEGEPKEDWARHAYRVLNIIDNQVCSLRVRQLVAAYQAGVRKGAYWGIRADIADYPVSTKLPCPHKRTLELANEATRLKRLDDKTQKRLINWGYAVCDAAIRSHVDKTIPEGTFPYPGAGV
jgi:NTE family protein